MEKLLGGGVMMGGCPAEGGKTVGMCEGRGGGVGGKLGCKKEVRASRTTVSPLPSLHKFPCMWQLMKLP